MGRAWTGRGRTAAALAPRLPGPIPAIRLHRRFGTRPRCGTAAATPTRPIPMTTATTMTGASAATAATRRAGSIQTKPPESAGRTKTATAMSTCAAIATMMNMEHGPTIPVIRQHIAGIGRHRGIAATIGGGRGGKKRDQLNCFARSLREQRTRHRAAVQPRPFLHSADVTSRPHHDCPCDRRDTV
jgi:hypothetical protein